MLQYFDMNDDIAILHLLNANSAPVMLTICGFVEIGFEA